MRRLLTAPRQELKPVGGSAHPYAIGACPEGERDIAAAYRQFAVDENATVWGDRSSNGRPRAAPMLA
jgi:hypothetical protein